MTKKLKHKFYGVTAAATIAGGIALAVAVPLTIQKQETASLSGSEQQGSYDRNRLNYGDEFSGAKTYRAIEAFIHSKGIKDFATITPEKGVEILKQSGLSIWKWTRNGLTQVNLTNIKANNKDGIIKLFATVIQGGRVVMETPISVYGFKQEIAAIKIPEPKPIIKKTIKAKEITPAKPIIKKTIKAKEITPAKPIIKKTLKPTEILPSKPTEKFRKPKKVEIKQKDIVTISRSNVLDEILATFKDWGIDAQHITVDKFVNIIERTFILKKGNRKFFVYLDHFNRDDANGSLSFQARISENGKSVNNFTLNFWGLQR